MSKLDQDSDDEEQIFKQYKIILLGDGAVGKTSIANRFADDKFAQTYKQTVGVDFFMRRLQLNSNTQVALQIWDIGGQSIGSKMITSYIAGAHAILFCYDITNIDSFANLEDWYRIAISAQEDEMPFSILIGNKNDLQHMSVVRLDAHTEFAKENDMASFLMSAKNGDQVNQAFWKIASYLSGIPLTKGDIDSRSNIVPAQIVDHERNDSKVNKGQLPDYNKKACTVS
mmetsp:Transcript_23193/g.39261  ORF Transcript_23193/g.39261 Transcript_23193/m.39261 type:complete len:228 (-) Transcript_23193:623-1306(-)|eukprot:CAMPEP_0114429704 /NCGR_PEP_ID=MMETSP0103-20121206/9635_1 /TAXON_ID=37642 ORGANISM="Paraphysomonas imperforata, Strain PA2" /NCGR_SAMPLE_ID=MMETSP0103 /ASSEMBLY_ACC=CAM_ASM_000201 /LENGTH=227 /DNA_ID=CAMNT_0001599073 /DNA_START=24 /DNA_END=707 /DNA_ORIENTATION=+